MLVLTYVYEYSGCIYVKCTTTGLVPERPELGSGVTDGSHVGAGNGTVLSTKANSASLIKVFLSVCSNQVPASFF